MRTHAVKYMLDLPMAAYSNVILIKLLVFPIVSPYPEGGLNADTI